MNRFRRRNGVSIHRTDIRFSPGSKSDVDGREVDFVLADRRGPTHLIEVKWSDRPVDKALRYLHARFPDATAIQISATGSDDYRTQDGSRRSPWPCRGEAGDRDCFGYKAFGSPMTRASFGTACPRASSETPA